VTLIVGEAQGQRDGGSDHHTLIDKSGAAMVSVIDQADGTSFIVRCSCWACRNALDVVRQNMAVKARAAKNGRLHGVKPNGDDGAAIRVSAMPRHPENRPVRLSKHARERVDAGEVRLDWIKATVRHPA
jgi:hypothetical protein